MPIVHNPSQGPGRSAWRSTVASFVDILLPPLCTVCRTANREAGGRLCAECTTAVEMARAVGACPTCAATVAPFEVQDGRCRECRGRRPNIGALVRVGAYKGVLGHMLRQCKYNGRDELVSLTGGWLVESVSAAPWLPRVEAVCCVPSYWTRRMTTRLYPAGELARFAAQRLGLPFSSLLRRVRGGPHQVGLSHQQRLANVRGAFAMRKGVQLQEARLLLIDDVRTTGATMNECAKVLRRAGAQEVYGAVVVRARAG